MKVMMVHIYILLHLLHSLKFIQINQMIFVDRHVSWTITQTVPDIIFLISVKDKLT